MDKFEKVIEKDQEGNDIEVLKVTAAAVTVESRSTLEQEEALLDGLKAHKKRELERWDAKVEYQRKRFLEAAKASGVEVVDDHIV